MESRTEKYSENQTRTNKNKQLYKDLYKDTNYSNMVVIDDSNEIDINKIQQILDKEKRPTRASSYDEPYDSLKDYYKIQTDDEMPRKKYDINEVLKEAKNKRNIIEEANEKRKIENYKFKNSFNLEDELAKTRKIYNDLVKEETELLNIMNTLTSADIQTKKNIDNTTSMALDLLNTIDEPKKSESGEELKVKKVEDENSKEYSTDTFMFETKDFDGLKTVKDGIEKNNKAVTFLIILFTIIIIIVCYFLITNFVLNK